VSTFLGLAFVAFGGWMIYFAVARPWYWYLKASELPGALAAYLAGRARRRQLRALMRARAHAAALAGKVPCTPAVLVPPLVALAAAWRAWQRVRAFLLASPAAQVRAEAELDTAALAETVTGLTEVMAELRQALADASGRAAAADREAAERGRLLDSLLGEARYQAAAAPSVLVDREAYAELSEFMREQARFGDWGAAMAELVRGVYGTGGSRERSDYSSWPAREESVIHDRDGRFLS
jgi:hypothetical protein